MSFNPANFPWTMPAIKPVRDAGTTYGNQPDDRDVSVLTIAGDLKAAARRFAQRTDGFAQGKADTCLDIAAKLERFGSFASEKQAEFARKLIEWSKPWWEQQPQEDMVPQYGRPAPSPVKPNAVPNLPKLHALMQRLAKLTIGKLQIVRKNQDSLCWIKHEDCEKVVGRLTDGGSLTLWNRPQASADVVLGLLLAIEQDPEAAAVLHGKASGRCAVCSRDLTDPESIARGIGPICAEKF